MLPRRYVPDSVRCLERARRATAVRHVGPSRCQIAAKALTESGAPSVSIAIVQGGKIAFEKAYGKARLEPPADARPEMRYSIGSVSKQLLAGCVLLLVQDGKLSLDDRVSALSSRT